MAEFPSRILFKPTSDCHRIAPKPTIDGDLADWGDLKPLPRLCELDGHEGFADVWVAWADDGLYIAERCPKPQGTVSVNRQRPHAGDGLQAWVDTRATQNAHRATRFCHQFIFLPKGAGAGRSQATAWQANIRRARERASLCNPSDIRIASFIGEGFYTIEAHLPLHVLGGFGPSVGSQIGFNYVVHDIPSGSQRWSAPRGFPMDWDPSLWGLLELVD